MATTFHQLTIRDVEPLTEDSAAVTFDVPDDLRELFAFEPGESLTLRRVVDGVEHRRTYSICAPAGAAPRIRQVIPVCDQHERGEARELPEHHELDQVSR